MRVEVLDKQERNHWVPEPGDTFTYKDQICKTAYICVDPMVASRGLDRKPDKFVYAVDLLDGTFTFLCRDRKFIRVRPEGGTLTMVESISYV